MRISGGFWSGSRSEYAKWTEEDRIQKMGEICMRVDELRRKAKAADLNDLIGKPVETVVDGNRVVSWRILEEVL